jgi:hypothetical protein
MSERAASDILRDVVDDVQELFRSEVRLVKAEISEQAIRAKGAGGYLGGAAIAGFLAALCFLACCIAALATAIPFWAAALLVSFVLAAIGATLYAHAKMKLRDFHAMPQQSVQSIKEDVAWLKQRTR